jgi:YaiO family outer membrane protein
MKTHYSLVVLSLVLPIDATASYWLESGAEFQHYTNGRANANIQYVAGSWAQNDLTVYGDVTRTDRFERVDSQFTLGSYIPITQNGKLHLEARLSPSQNLLPGHVLYAGYYWAAGHGWTFEPSYQVTSFSDLRIERTALVTEKYTGPWRFAYQLANVSLRNDNALNHQIRADYFWNDVDRTGLFYAFGDEQEAAELDPNAVTLTSVKAYGITGMQRLTDQWMLTYTVSQTQQGDIFTQTGARLGLRRSF